jgi:hypothetical protein
VQKLPTASILFVIKDCLTGSSFVSNPAWIRLHFHTCTPICDLCFSDQWMLVRAQRRGRIRRLWLVTNLASGGALLRSAGGNRCSSTNFMRPWAHRGSYQCQWSALFVPINQVIRFARLSNHVRVAYISELIQSKLKCHLLRSAIDDVNIDHAIAKHQCRRRQVVWSSRTWTGVSFSQLLEW